MPKNYLGNDDKVVRVRMTRKRALEFGLVHCKYGYPPNNHFDFGKKKCVLADECPGYKEIITA